MSPASTTLRVAFLQGGVAVEGFSDFCSPSCSLSVQVPASASSLWWPQGTSALAFSHFPGVVVMVVDQETQKSWCGERHCCEARRLESVEVPQLPRLCDLRRAAEPL